MLTRRTRIVPLLSVVTLACGVAYAQNITGSIVGQVSDSSGLAVPAAAISAKSIDTGLAAQTITDSSGLHPFYKFVQQ